MKSITKRQSQIMDYIYKYMEENPMPPTIIEIREHFGFSSNQGVVDHLKALEKKGYIRKEAKARGIIPLKKKDIFPIIGKIAAGNPIMAQEDYSLGTLKFEDFFNKENTYVLQVRGNSMINAGIHDGDYVFVHYQDIVKNNEIGVAVINEEATVKRILFKGKKIILQPENEDFTPIEITKGAHDFRIAGKVVGVFRNMAVK